jgi:ComF family protein
MKTGNLVFFLREFFFPSGCALCGAVLVSPEEAWYGLCRSCRRPPPAGERCGSCGRPLVSEQGFCLACRNGDERSLDRGILLYPYRGTYRRLLGAYKFGGNLGLGHFFAEKIRDVLRALPPGEAGGAEGTGGAGLETETPVLVPVPPRPGKLRRTGWDQVEYLAKLLESGPFPVSRCLRRLPSRHQKELNRENRKTNLRGKIVLAGKAPPRAIILDDVCTTGSTLEACAAALKAGGTKEAAGLCLFYD